MRYLAKRGALFLVTLWAALTVNFIIPRVMPGNEAQAVLATFRGANPGALHALEIQFGVNVHQSVLTSYFQYLGNCLTGQFGVTAQGVPVMTEIGQKLPWTLGLVGVTTVIAFVIGTVAGVASAWRRGGRLDAVLPPTLFIVSTVPVFFVGLLLIYLFAVKLNLLPLSGNYSVGATPSFSLSFISDVLKHAILPGAQPGDRDRRPVGVLDAQQHDHDDRRGLRQDGPRQGARRPADHVRLRRAQRDPSQPDRVRDAAGVCPGRRDRDRVPVLVSRARVSLDQS
jgi:ABC-type microcin C transport system permease subunit YejB